MSHYGVDVSSNNPHPINWVALYKYLLGLGNETPFVVIKISQGVTYENIDFTTDLAQAKAAGFIVAGYLMDQGNDVPADEVALYRRIAGSLPMFDDDELPEGLSTSGYISHLQSLIQIAPTIQYLNQAEVAEKYSEGTGLWLAEYNGSPSQVSYPCLIHQYTSSGYVPNCSGQFDLNVWMGTEQQFSAIFNAAPPPPPTPTPTPMEARMAVTQLLSFKPGQRDLLQVPPGSGKLLHYWSVNGGPWQPPEVLLGPSGGVAKAAPVAVADGIPQYSLLGGNNTVTVEDSSGNPWTCAQASSGPADDQWGVNEVSVS